MCQLSSTPTACELNADNHAAVILEEYDTKAIPPTLRTNCKLGCAKKAKIEGVEPGDIFHRHFPLHWVHVYPDDCHEERIR